jgi:copper chaperone
MICGLLIQIKSPHLYLRHLSTMIWSPMMNQHFDVSGMTCGHCEKAVTQAVRQIDPQAQVSIDRSQGRVDVVSSQPREVLAKAIADEGYRVAP